MLDLRHDFFDDSTQHGATAIGNGKSLYTDCHGDDYTGESSNKSCFSCHAIYPHTDKNWLSSGRSSVHATKFISLIKNGESTVCTKCHGPDYSTNLNGKSCLTCHTNGVTHNSLTWSKGAGGHGDHFATYYDSDSTSANCFECHGQKITFEDSQMVSDLETQNDCYSCHWSYPHTSYTHTTSSGSTSINHWIAILPSDYTTTYAHSFYIQFSYALVDKTGYTPDKSGDYTVWYDPLTQDSIANTCGRNTPGNCHYEGYRQNTETLSCMDYCH